MKNLLSLAALTLMAQEIFDANPTLDKVFATADGNLFLPSNHNLARNHARQENLMVYEISGTGVASDDILDHIQTDAKANELKHEAAAAEAAAHAATLPTVPATGEAVPVEAAALAQATGKSEAVEATAKAIDAPATEGTADAGTAKPAAKAAAAKPAAKPAAKAT